MAYRPELITDNLGIRINAGVVKITSKNGSDLSGSNPAHIYIPSTTAGRMVTLAATSSPSFQDAASGASDIVNSLFGTTTGVAWASGTPFYIYAVNTNDTSAGLYFAISRNPCWTQTPFFNTRIGYKGNPPALSTVDGMWFLTSTNVTAQTDKPVVCIGCFSMTKSAGDDWTASLNFFDDGIGRFYEGRQFVYVAGQNGAASGSFIKDNGGTAPAFQSNTYTYTVSRDGRVGVNIILTGDPGAADGVGAVDAIVTLPFGIAGSVELANGVASTNSVGKGPKTRCVVYMDTTSGGFKIIHDDAGTFLTNGDFANGAREIRTSLWYRAFHVN